MVVAPTSMQCYIQISQHHVVIPRACVVCVCVRERERERERESQKFEGKVNEQVERWFK